MHDTSVLCVAWSRDSEFLASGSQDGKIKVWQVRTGKCLRRFEQGHLEGVTCLSFARDGTQILSGSFDATLRMHGLKSGKTLKIFRGHTSYVNDCLFTPEGSRVLSASSDGSIKVWDAKTSDCLQTLKSGGALKETTIQSIFIIPKNMEQLLVCSRTPTVQIMTLKGQVVKSFTTTKKETTANGVTVDKGVDILCCCLSPRGDFLYCVADDNVLYCFDVQNGTLVHSIPVHKKVTIGIAHHPHINLIATYSDEGAVKLWKP